MAARYRLIGNKKYPLVDIRRYFILLVTINTLKPILSLRCRWQGGRQPHRSLRLGLEPGDRRTGEEGEEEGGRGAVGILARWSGLVGARRHAVRGDDSIRAVCFLARDFLACAFDSL